MCQLPALVTKMTSIASFDGTVVADLEKRIIDVLKEHEQGLTSDELERQTPNVENLLRGHVVNKLLSANTLEMLAAKGPAGSGLILRLRRGIQLDNATAEEQLVFSLIEESDTKGIWIRDVRTASGLSDTQLRKVLKVLEQRKLVKAVKAVGTTKKCYMLYNLEADESLTGGTFYSDQQLDSQFVQTLAQVCVNLLQARRRLAEEMNKNDFHAQREVAFIKSEEVAAYIVDKGICKVHLGLADVESILDVAVLDGRLEKRLMDGAYRARKVRARPTAMAAVPCLHCPMQFECKTGHLISPEQCEYLKQYFEL